MPNSFGAQATFRVGNQEYCIFRLDAVAKRFPQVTQLPYSLKILLENLLRTEDGQIVQPEDIEALATWQAAAEPSREIAFTPSRVLLQDFTGVPAVVDLAAMRDAMKRMGGDPRRINPLQPVELVIDHSVQVDEFGSAQAFRANAELEFARNRERYLFLRWGQKAFRNFKVVPPDTGIVHQVNLEYLARVVFTQQAAGEGTLPSAYPDTVVGTDSHTTMINGLGVLGWGVGGIEAEAAMLGQPMSMLIPQVVGFRLFGTLPEGATATDLVLTVTEMLRKKGVVGKFVEFYGEGLASLSLADRATIANMAPEYGATCGIFPVDAETLRYLRFSGRPEKLVQLVEAYTKEQGLFHTASTPPAHYSDKLELDLRTVEPCLAGPTRPQDRVPLSKAKQSFAEALQMLLSKSKPKPSANAIKRLEGEGGAQTAVGAQTSTHESPRLISLTVTAAPDTKVYDGTTTSTAVPTITAGSLAPGDKACFVQTYDNKHIGTRKTLTPSGFVDNKASGCTYQVIFESRAVGQIEPRPITVSATPESKVYDGTTMSAAIPIIIAGSLAPGDTANFIQTYDNKRVAATKTLTPSGKVNDGNEGRNYTVTFVPITTGQPVPVASLESAVSELRHGSVVIAAITSCTNTSNPSVLMAAGLLAKKAVERGLQTKPWVKTSLAPGSKVVTDYLIEAGLMRYLEQLRFYLVGYGCTTCIGNSGPLPAPVSRAIEQGDLIVVAVLSGNRNFEGRIHPEVRANYLASPPLVVAYALAGHMDIDLLNEPLGRDPKGQPVYLRDIWPSQQEVQQAIDSAIRSDMFRNVYEKAFEGDAQWNSLAVPEGDLFAWQADSTYVRHPPYFLGMDAQPAPLTDIYNARVLALLGDSITTDHISPAGSIKAQSPAGRYLIEHGVEPKDFNSYGARRGNHEVMIRGTFANIRLRNLLAPGTEGGITRHLPDGEQMSIFDAAMQYQKEGVPLVVIAGKEYGSGSSRDWAAKGPRLLGVRVVIAESYERIHRSNLVGMGVLPLQFRPGESAKSLELTGEEVFDIVGLTELLTRGLSGNRHITVRARYADGSTREFQAVVRIDTPQEVLYYQHGGILQYVLRQLLGQK